MGPAHSDADLKTAYEVVKDDLLAMLKAGYNPELESDWDRFKLGIAPFNEPVWAPTRGAK